MVFKVDLMAKVQDSITGFKGTVTGRTEYSTGCRQYCVTPLAKDGAFIEAQWLDEDRLIAQTDENPGGPAMCQPPRK